MPSSFPFPSLFRCIKTLKIQLGDQKTSHLDQNGSMYHIGHIGIVDIDANKGFSVS